MNHTALLLLAMACFTCSGELLASGAPSATEARLVELSAKARSAGDKKGYAEIVNAILEDQDLQEEAERDVRIPLLRAACLFKLGEKETAINLIRQKVLPLSLQSGSGYTGVALRLAQSDLPGEELSKELNRVLEGHAEVEISAVSGKDPLAGRIVATDADNGRVFDLQSTQENAITPVTRHLPSLLPPGTYRLSLLYHGKRMDGGDLEVTAWQKISRKVSFQVPREIAIRSPKQNEKLTAGTKLNFRWQWPLENKENFVIELSRIVNEYERHRIWGPYETKDTSVVYNIDNTASAKTLLPGMYELSVLVSSGEKFSKPRGKAVVFEVIQSKSGSK
jgi:hypothetical protein